MLLSQKHKKVSTTLNYIEHFSLWGKNLIDLTNTDLKNKVVQVSEKGYYFLLSRMYFTGDDGY